MANIPPLPNEPVGNTHTWREWFKEVRTKLVTLGAVTGAPNNASYVVVGASASLTNERVLTAGTNISLVDGGAGGPLTINLTGVTWSILTGTPTTLAGYGITDATPSSHIGSGGAQHAPFTNVAAGFAPASGGGTTNYLRADGSWAAPTATVTITEVELDFGATATRDKTFTVVDASVSGASKILFNPSGAIPTGGTGGEAELDTFVCRCVAAAGSFSVYVSSLFGPVTGKYKFNYLVG